MQRKRHAKGVPKKPTFKSDLEARYAAHLECRKIAGDLRDWRYEPIRLRLADGTFYKPDFMVMAMDDVIEIHESKGHMREAARVRLNVAVEMFPFRFFLVSALGKDNFEVTRL